MEREFTFLGAETEIMDGKKIYIARYKDREGFCFNHYQNMGPENPTKVERALEFLLGCFASPCAMQIAHYMAVWHSYDLAKKMEAEMERELPLKVHEPEHLFEVPEKA